MFSIGIFLSLLSTIICFFNNGVYLVYLTSLIGWILSIAIIHQWSLREYRSNASIKIEDNSTIKFCAILLVVAASIHFFKLTEYPFYSIHDELRDGGFQAMEFALGQRKNMFQYGYNGSHGLIIPFINSFFFKIFGSSYLTYRLPAALTSTLSVLLVFVTTKSIIGKWRAFASALFLCLMIHHIYYARTEVVVAWSTLIGVIIFYLANNAIYRKYFSHLLLLSLYTGVAFSFHAGIRMISLITLAVLTAYFIHLKRIKFNQSLQLLATFLVGIGPRIIYTTLLVLVPGKRVINLQGETFYELMVNYLSYISSSYREALSIIFIDPTAGWFPGHPMISLCSGVFLIVGVILGTIKREPLVLLGSSMILLTALTNDALTTSRLLEHRYAGCFPIFALIVIYGASSLSILIKSQSLRKIVSTSCVLVALISESGRVYNFFKEEQATAKYPAEVIDNYYQLSYLRNDIMMHKAYKDAPFICIITNPDKNKLFLLKHVTEYFWYFFPDKVIKNSYDSSLNLNTIAYVLDECPTSLEKLNYTEAKYCKDYAPYICPRTKSSFEMRYINLDQK